METAPECARLRDFLHSSLRFANLPSRLHFPRKYIPKYLTSAFQFCIFVVSPEDISTILLSSYLRFTQDDKKKGIPLVKGVGGCPISIGISIAYSQHTMWLTPFGVNIPLPPFIRGRAAQRLSECINGRLSHTPSPSPEGNPYNNSKFITHNSKL